MDSVRRALFIGRFQPFHLGHLSVLVDIQKAGYDEVIIGIGSSQYSGTEDNPLTSAQRITLIEAVLQSSTSFNLPYTIVEMPDIHDDSQWVSHITGLAAEYSGKFAAVYTGNDWTTRLFSDTDITIVPVNFVVEISATQIRQMIQKDNSEWEHYVHSSIIDNVKVLLA